MDRINVFKGIKSLSAEELAAIDVAVRASLAMRPYPNKAKYRHAVRDEEISAWNAAVDAKKRAKKGA